MDKFNMKTENTDIIKDLKNLNSKMELTTKSINNTIQSSTNKLTNIDKQFITVSVDITQTLYGFESRLSDKKILNSLPIFTQIKTGDNLKKIVEKLEEFENNSIFRKDIKKINIKINNLEKLLKYKLKKYYKTILR